MPTIYFASGSTIFGVSGKEGEWSISEMDVGQGNIQAVAADPSSGTIYAGTFDNGLFRTQDQGETFEAVGENDLQQRVMALHRGFPEFITREEQHLVHQRGLVASLSFLQVSVPVLAPQIARLYPTHPTRFAASIH